MKKNPWSLGRAFSASFLLLAVALAGCTTSLQGDDPATVGAAAPAPIGPGDASDTRSGFSVRVHDPVPLPGPHSDEPSIAVTATTGVVAVAAPAPERNNPSVFTHGGYVWTSNDGGESYTLRLDPSDPEPPRGVACSCDTDVTAVGDTLYASTMYWSVFPLFDANVVASTDGGESWETRSLAASQLQYLDRPWIAPGPQEGSLMLQYEAFKSRVDSVSWAVTDGYQAVWFQQSNDDGLTWTEPVKLVEDGEHVGYAHTKPVSIAPDTVLVPLLHLGDEPRGTGSLWLMVSHDGGQSFERVVLADAHDFYAMFHVSIDATPDGRVVFAWSTPDASGANKIHIRESLDKGDTWGPTRVVDLTGHALQPWVSLRDDGVLAVSYYGTDAEGPFGNLSEETPWYARTMLFGPDDADAPAAVATLTTEPIYRGLPCNFSDHCFDLNLSIVSPLREFLSSDWGPDGSLFVAFTDAMDLDEDGKGRITVTRMDVPMENGA